jgi:hypothetical protein
MTPEELVAAGERYARATGYPIQYQWTLLEGVNDGADEIEGIVRLLSGKYGVLNMIPFNAVDGVAFSRPSWERCEQIARTLHRARHPDQAAQFGRAGRRRRLRPAAAPAAPPRSRGCRRPRRRSPATW